MDKIKEVLIIGVFTGLVGTIVHFAVKAIKFTWKLFLTQVIISIFVGSVTTSAMLHFFPELPTHLVASISALLALWSNAVVNNVKVIIDKIFEVIKIRIDKWKKQ